MHARLSSSPRHRARLAILWGALTGVAPSRAVAQCPRSTFVMSPALHEVRWLAATASLHATLAGSDRPWHCVGASVRLLPGGDGGAVLEVTRPSGVSVRRRIASPAELVPTLQAVLIVGSPPTLELPAEPPPTTPPAPPPVVAPPAPPPVVAPPAPPPAVAPAAPLPVGIVPPAPVAAPPPVGRFLEGFIETGMRLGATPSYGSFAVRAAVALRLHVWSVFAWGRVEPWTQRLADRGPGRYLLDIGVLGLGASLGWLLGRGRIEAGLTLSANSYTWRDRALLPGQKESFVQVRLGALARWRSHARGLGFVVTLDADLSPATLFEDVPAPSIPKPPAWSAGLMVGMSYGGAL